MNPMAMMAMMTALSALSGLGGKGEKHGSTYSKGARSAIDDVLNSISNMRSGAQDVSQNPNYQTGQNWLQSMFSDPEFFNKFEAPLQRQYQEQTIPDLANRFASMGSGGALGSTAFRNQLAREGSNLSTNLAALRGGMQQQAIPQLLGYSQQPFQNLMSLYNVGLTPTQNTYQPASGGFFGNMLPGFAGGFSQGMGQQTGMNMAQGQSPSTMPGYGAGWDAMFRQMGV